MATTKADPNTFAATGRRRTAVARANITSGTGQITINGREIDEYFITPAQKISATRPLLTTELHKSIDVVARTNGGGLNGQAGAVSHAIARALCEMDSELRPRLKAAGLLTRDPRMKERKKSGQPGARKRFQFSKR